jgi:hypothetical protein
MGFKKAADGVVKKGKTDVQIFPNSGPTAPNPRGGKKSSGVTSEAMMKVGRNMARAMNQKKG